jgi:DNA recombination protein RmuC
MDPIALLLGLLLGAGMAGASAWWLLSRLRQCEAELAAARVRELAAVEQLAIARAQAEAAATREQDAMRNRDQLRNEFEQLGTRLLDEKGKAMLADSKLGLEGVLNPLRERIKEFEEKVARVYDQENRDRTSILEALKRVDLSQARLGHEAETLSRALSGQSKVQGDWGEMILENMLQSAGLQEGREYVVQSSHTGDDGSRLRPDVVINLPDGKAVVVDSKVSLTAFLAATAATDDAARDLALTAHRASLRAHVKGLAGKSYQEVVGDRRLDFTVLFMPSEPAFHAALSRDPGIYDEAMRQGVVLASPTTLLATLRVVALVWSHEKQNANAQRIAEEAGRLLDKLAGFVEDLDMVGTRLDQARDAWGGARAKLATGRGNLMNRAQKLHELGARLGKGGKTHELLGLGGEEAAESED